MLMKFLIEFQKRRVTRYAFYFRGCWGTHGFWYLLPTCYCKKDVYTRGNVKVETHRELGFGFLKFTLAVGYWHKPDGYRK
jgi:hypothetical protein